MVERDETPGSAVSRRAVLGLGVVGLGVVGAVGAGMSGALDLWPGRATATPEIPDGAANLTGGHPIATKPPASVADWRAGGPPFYIAHRGAGIVLPEHSLEAYHAALDWGATCLEISIGMTSDGVLICLHDATYDRTTTLTGPVAEQPSAVLAKGRIDIPRLGPRWQGDGRPQIPLLDDVLAQIGPHAILCLEAKDDNAFKPMMKAAAAHGLNGRIYAKLHLPATARVAQARAAKVPIFMYAGTATDLAPARLDPVLRDLDRARDVIVLPAVVDNAPIDPRIVSRVVGRGVPVWMYPVMRRSEAAHFLSLGAQGLITPDIGYVSSTTASAQADTWAKGALASGELTRFPYSEKFGVRWGDPATDAGVIRLDVPGESSYLLLGQLCPVAPPDGSYQLEFDYRFDAPATPEQALTVAFGRADDRYVGPTAEAGSTGYRVVLRPDGYAALLADDGGTTPTRRTLAQASIEPTPVDVPVPGWKRLGIAVTPTSISVSRAGVEVLKSTHTAYRGGYVHIGRDGRRGPISLRRVRVTTPGDPRGAQA